MLNPGAFEDRRQLLTRLTVLRLVSVAIFVLLAFAFWLLQVVHHDKYGPWADKNYLRTIPLRAPRGVLFDRHGRVLVENRDSFTIAFLRERSANVDDAVRMLAGAVGLDEARVREPIQRAIARRDPAFRPVPIVEHATLAQVVAVKARQFELPEVVVQQVPARKYPDDRLAAHLFGYVGEIQEQQLGRPEFTGLESGAVVGQTGVERIYNARLQGADGSRSVVVNSVGREIGEPVGEEPPREGTRMQLTIDYDVQKALEDSFKASGFDGAGVLLDPRTGEVIALTSLPAYDPNVFASGIDRAAWASLTTDRLKPMNNRLIQGTYSPGSTFKIVMAVAGLMEGVITPETQVFCPGHATWYGRTFKCNAAHGTVAVRAAIERSCNVFFYHVGSKLSIDTINRYSTMLGLTGKTGIDLPNEESSLVPSTEWARRYRKSQPKWYAGETISVAIGQGAVSVTPLSLATMIATVANGGTLVTPHLARAVDEGHGWVPVPVPPTKSAMHINPDAMQAIRDGLWAVVNGESGTARRSKIPGRDIAGKTGTAQVVSLEKKAQAARAGMDVRDHGFFVFFAPRDNPQVAGVVFAEHGGHGSDAAWIARHAIETFFNKRDGLPLPVLPLKAVTPPAASPNQTAATPRNQTREIVARRPEPGTRR